MTPVPSLLISADTADGVLASVEECSERKRGLCEVGFTSPAECDNASRNLSIHPCQVPTATSRPCPECHGHKVKWRAGVEWQSYPCNGPCNGSGRVPAPDALRRLVYPDRPTVPCPTCDGEKATPHPEGVGTIPCVICEDDNFRAPGVVPLVGGMTVALAVERQCWEWSALCADDPCPAGIQWLCPHRQVPVAVAQVADVLPIVGDETPCDSPCLVARKNGELMLFERPAPSTGRFVRWASDGQDYSPGRWVVVLSEVDPCDTREVSP